MKILTMPNFATAQRGTVLLVSTVILLALSLLAVAIAKTAVFENKMVSASRSAQLARLGADSAMSDARAQIARLVASKGADAVCASLGCAVRDAAAPVDPSAFMQTNAARAAAIPFRVDLSKLPGGDESAQLVSPPVYVIEDLGVAPAKLDPPTSARRLFRITAKASGSTEGLTRAIESVYAVAQETPPSG
jgi:Tfp pilus assembly protein PilX